ncbi:hypothetical protein SOM08_06265 [Hydrogenophaga sp. SNF1]|nr:hypothetical protein [Hydrogenophaga sp. SNF1]WQB84916.1 hypothetical protein SOM08_06265 [Hydrogenophaga sp. SNF1]
MDKLSAMPCEHPCEQIEGVGTFDTRACDGSGGVLGGATEAGGKGGKLPPQALSSSASVNSVALSHKAGLVGFICGFLHLCGAASFFGSGSLGGAARLPLPIGMYLGVLVAGVGMGALLVRQAPGLQPSDGGEPEQQPGTELHASPTVAGASPITKSWSGRGTASGQR